MVIQANPFHNKALPLFSLFFGIKYILESLTVNKLTFYTIIGFIK